MSASERAWARRAIVRAAVLVLAAALTVMAGCDDPRDSPTAASAEVGTPTSATAGSATSVAAVSTTTTVAPAVVETIYPTETTSVTVPTGSPAPPADIVAQIAALPGDIRTVNLSSDALLVQTLGPEAFGGLHAYLFSAQTLVELPVSDDVYVDGAAIEGDLVVWTESRFSGMSVSSSQAYAYRLPDGPKVEIGVPAASVVDDGRVFWTEWTHVSGDVDQGEVSLDSCVIWMVDVDEYGNPESSPVEVTNRPNSSYEPAGDELWSYGVEGSHLAYQRMWGDEPGVHLVDLRTGRDTYLGEGDIPSVSDSLVAWRGPIGDQGWDVRVYSLTMGRAAVLAAGAHMPFAGPGYVLCMQSSDLAMNSVIHIDEHTGSITSVGDAMQRGGNPFISLAGSEEYLAWVTITEDGAAVQLVAVPKQDAVEAGQPESIWVGAQDPPLVAP